MREVRQQLREINLILWKDWDPIGCGVPQDEYQSYAPEVLRLLIDGADLHRLSGHLQSVAKLSLSCPISDAKAKDAAIKLLGLRLQ